jgi:hypothetical protein
MPGSAPVEAVNADEAMSILESRSDISLLFTDIQMPGSMDPFVYAPDVEPYISKSGDLTRDKIAKLVEMVIDTAGS